MIRVHEFNHYRPRQQHPLPSNAPVGDDVSAVRDLGRMASDSLFVPFWTLEVHRRTDWLLLLCRRARCHLWPVPGRTAGRPHLCHPEDFGRQPLGWRTVSFPYGNDWRVQLLPGALGAVRIGVRADDGVDQLAGVRAHSESRHGLWADPRLGNGWLDRGGHHSWSDFVPLSHARWCQC